MRKTKIVCTIGPASEKIEVLEQLILNGLNVVRLNFSHGTHPEHLAKVNAVKELNKKLDTNVALMLDTKGPEIRLGLFEDNKKVDLVKGETFTLTTDDILGNEKIVSISYKNLPNDVTKGSHILIDDGLVDILVEKVEGNNIVCTVVNSGRISNNKSCNVPNTKLAIPALTEKDIGDIKFAAENDFDFIAASFIRKPQDVLDIKAVLKQNGNEKIKIISKIENQEGIDNFDEILKVSDGIMVARGDLGVEVPIEDLPRLQKMMIKKCVIASKFVITATQMLDSMIRNPRPTRAEVSDIANAIYDGTSAIMLSGETANGDYPIECVKMMNSIATKTECDINYWKRFIRKNSEILQCCETNIENNNISEFDLKKQINFSVCNSAMFSNAKAIVAVSEHGTTPAILSSFRPKCPVFVITANPTSFRQFAMEYGIYSVLVEGEYNFEVVLKEGIKKLREKGLLAKNDPVVLTGGYSIDTNTENYLSSQAMGAIIMI